MCIRLSRLSKMGCGSSSSAPAVNPGSAPAPAPSADPAAPGPAPSAPPASEVNGTGAAASVGADDDKGVDMFATEDASAGVQAGGARMLCCYCCGQGFSYASLPRHMGMLSCPVICPLSLTPLLLLLLLLVLL